MKKAFLLAALLIAIALAGCTGQLMPGQANPVQEYKAQKQSERLHSASAQLFLAFEDANAGAALDQQITEKRAGLAAETNPSLKLEIQKELFILETQKESTSQMHGLFQWLESEIKSSDSDLNSAATTEQVDEADAKAAATVPVSMVILAVSVSGMLEMQQKILSASPADFAAEETAASSLAPDVQKAKEIQGKDFNKIYSYCSLSAEESPAKGIGQLDESILAEFASQKEKIIPKCTDYMQKYVLQAKSNFSSSQDGSKKKIAAAYALLNLDALSEKAAIGSNQGPDFNWQNPDNNNQASADNCKESASESQKDACYKQRAVSENNTDLCQKLTIISKDDCIEEIAETTGAQELCTKISTESQRNLCYYTIGLAEGDAESCSRISQSSQDAIETR
ncbi:MAG: hypothetical protein PHH08_03520, partial [Candidatus ainarchaeum sp.]|nr:hypothetical protein [Candidatus ainarchaeum sp.]